MAVELVNADFVVSMTIGEVSLIQQERFTNDNTTGELKYKKKQTQVGVHKVTIIATDVVGNETEQLITVSVKAIGLSTSITWGGIGDDNKININ
jgi:hypothetical protein